MQAKNGLGCPPLVSKPTVGSTSSPVSTHPVLQPFTTWVRWTAGCLADLSCFGLHQGHACLLKGIAMCSFLHLARAVNDFSLLWARRAPLGPPHASNRTAQVGDDLVALQSRAHASGCGTPTFAQHSHVRRKQDPSRNLSSSEPSKASI